jgi:hypothetical protein
MGSLVQGLTHYAPKQKKYAERAEGERTAGLESARKQMQPYQEYGATAMERQNRLFNDPSYLQETGGYKFVLDQGLKSTTAARSNKSIFSGETLKALTEYSAGLASQEYAKEWDRFQKGIDVGANASGTIAEIEAGKGEASARASDQMATYWAGHEGTSRQFNSAWNSALASKMTGPSSGMGGS